MKDKHEHNLKSIMGHSKLLPALLVAALVLAVCCVLFRSFIVFFLFLLAVVGALIVRLFSGRLRASEGDIVLFWGLPGSGKTMLAVKTALEFKKAGWHIAGNREFCSSSEIPDYLFEKYHMGFFNPRPHTAYFIDEASLNGYDNRDFAKNFSRAGVLDFWKKVRHNQTVVFMTNQGWNEIDAKIRESLTKTIYYLENRGFYSVAVRMDKAADFDEETGQPVEGYCFPSLIDRLRDPSCQLYFLHSKYGQYYKSLNPDPLPCIDDIDQYLPTYDKHGIPIYFTKISPSQGESQGVIS